MVAVGAMGAEGAVRTEGLRDRDCLLTTPTLRFVLAAEDDWLEESSCASDARSLETCTRVLALALTAGAPEIGESGTGTGRGRGVDM